MKSRKRTGWKLICVILCVAILTTAMAGCSGSIKIKIGKYTVPGGVLSYYYGYYYLSLYTSTDTDTIASIALNQVQQYAAIEELCDSYKIKLEALERKDVLDAITDEISQDGGDDAFNAFLDGVDLTMKQYKDMMYLLKRYDKLKTYLYDQDSGTEKLTDDQVISYFNDHFLHLITITVATDACETTDQFTAAQALATEIQGLLDQGQSAADVGQQYADKYTAEKGGAYVTVTDTYTTSSELDSTVSAAVKDLEIGNHTAVVSTTSGYDLLAREEIDADYAKDHVSTYYTEASNAALSDKVSSTIDDMGGVKNPDAMDKCDLDAAVNAWYTLYSNMSSTTSTSSILDQFFNS